MLNFTLTHDLLQRACDRSGFFVPESGLVFFGLRGAVPAGGALLRDFASAQELRPAAIDHVTMACTIGQWKPAEKMLAVHLGSTVPNRATIGKALEHGGAGTNQLLPGWYKFRKGMHRQGAKTGHRAFRQASFQPVRRSRDNLSYDALDRIDLGGPNGTWVADNIHCAHSRGPTGFSSAGCQVVCGLPKSQARGFAPETGPWARFIETAYDAFSAQEEFIYVLFEAADFASGSDLHNPDAVQIVRFGSVGPAAGVVQQALIDRDLLQGPPDNSFGRGSLAALIAFQMQTLAPHQVDGVCGPLTAQALGITLPNLAAGPTSPPKIAPAPAPAIDAPDDSELAAATAPAPTGSAPLSPAEDKTMDNDDLAEIRTQLERLAAQYPELTPLNAALGPFLGRLLDGKKTVIGVVGAVLTTLLTPGGASATDVKALFEHLAPTLTGAAPILQPLFIALTLWGALGKIEKRLVNKL